MKIVAKFNFKDYNGEALCGEVYRSHNGEFIPDAITGMGKNYNDARRGVNDYLRRQGSTLINYIPVE